MNQPSFIRTVTAGTGFSPVHAPWLALVGCPREGITTDRELGHWPAPCPEGYWIVFMC